VIIYYSGHAGLEVHVPETVWDDEHFHIGPYDATAGKPGMPIPERLELMRRTTIRDDLLARWLEELSGRQVVLMVDTCHSGTLTQTRKQAEMLAKQVDHLKDVGQLNLVVMTCCAKDEQALFEGTPNKTMWFTYFLSEAIKQLPSPLTTRAAFESTRKSMQEMLEKRHEVRAQEPQMSDSSLLPVYLAP